MATSEDFPSDDALLWYLAGVFDGEGCVTASISKAGGASSAITHNSICCGTTWHKGHAE